ncbi:RMD1 family protein [Noviherbaspirillum soli]|uniref:RMD1 family protein n=1 Tax=Noviherbaspirillum soli TaxID=1064518 RepID=UPI00188DB5F2|nr:RMD1 family protein [Noviherbaspirillum soli]
MTQPSIPHRPAINWTPRAGRRRSRTQRIVRREGKPLIAATEFTAAVAIVAERIDIKALAHLPMVAQSPLMVRLPGAGVAAIFRYGAVAFFAEEAGDREWLMASIGPASSGKGDALAEEKATVIVDPETHEGPVGNAIHIHAADRDRLQLLAEVMSKAAMLSFQERRSAGEFDRIEPLAQDLADDGRFSVRSQELMRAVGNMLLSEHRLTSRAEVMDKPELLWSNSHLEGLHARLEGDYEIIDRAKALERKLATLVRTAETLLETVRYKSSHRVEWYIVALIVMELVVSLYGHFGH